jgi:ArsR family transcriptional regulator, arsenate/arsenite/antimonite-responsive transcriptional repressor
MNDKRCVEDGGWQISPAMENNAAIAALSALAQETRLAIFTMLARGDCIGLSASDIGVRLNIPLATLSYHLSLLKRAGLVSSRRHARMIMYSANHGAIDGLIEHLIKNCHLDGALNVRLRH